MVRSHPHVLSGGLSPVSPFPNLCVCVLFNPRRSGAHLATRRQEDEVLGERRPRRRVAIRAASCWGGFLLLGECGTRPCKPNVRSQVVPFIPLLLSSLFRCTRCRVPRAPEKLRSRALAIRAQTLASAELLALTESASAPDAA